MGRYSSMLRFALIACGAAAAIVAPLASPAAVDSLVTAVGPSGSFNRNANDEPSMAVDASRPSVLAISAHEHIDLQPCSKAASVTSGRCSTFSGNALLPVAGVGITGVYFSFDSGPSWRQPTYQGLTAAACNPADEPCVPDVGPIHTVPNYYEHGLRTAGDPTVVFGPMPDENGRFSLGERLTSVPGDGRQKSYQHQYRRGRPEQRDHDHGIVHR